MKILGIETSCDETAAAVVEDGYRVLSNIVYSQVPIHQPYYGVVPEVASRNHLVKVLDVIDAALTQANVVLKDIDAIAVTNGPGLLGSLLVGLSTAKAIAYSYGLRLIPVNHIEAHLYAAHLETDIEFPYIGLVVSGGHTILYRVDGFHQIQMLGSTIDDAIGEAFDKVAKLLGLPYPGGPEIDRVAHNGDSNFLELPKVMTSRKSDQFNFSYSGLKTAIAYRIREMKLTPQTVSDVAASFQKTAIDLLIIKVTNALKHTGIRRLVVSGGVAANTYLRVRFGEMIEQGIQLFLTPLQYCGDNAAMVAGRGYVDLKAGKIGDLTTEAFSRLEYVKKGKRLVK